MDTCAACPNASYSPLASSSLQQCVCNAGYTGPDGGACEACGVGTFKAANGSSSCVACGSGKFLNTSANDAEADCLTCPAFTNSPSRSPSLSACICNEGYTGPDGSGCTACAAGSYKPSNGSAPCTLCAPGQYSPTVGMFASALARLTNPEVPRER